MKHDIKGDMKREGEALKAEKAEPAGGDPQDRKGQYNLPRTKPKKKPTTIAFMDVPGSDPSAAMKGDNMQVVKGGTGPNSKPQPPRQFNLPRDRQRRSQQK